MDKEILTNNLKSWPFTPLFVHEWFNLLVFFVRSLSVKNYYHENPT